MNRPEAEARNENRPGFIGPRLPTDLKPAVSRPPVTPTPLPLNNDENAPRKRLLDGTVKISEEKKKAKVSTSLVPSYDDEDSSGSDSSLSPDTSQVLTAKATTPADWQVTVVRSPSVSSEGSSKTNWNVTPRTPPAQRKVNNCSSDNDTDPKTDNSLTSAASLDRTVVEKASQEAPSDQLPLSPASLLKNGFQENSYKKKNDRESGNERSTKDSRSLLKENSQNRSRTPHRSEESSSSHSAPWKNGGSSSYNGGQSKNYQFDRNNSSNFNSSNGTMAERSMHNGHSQTKNWGKDSDAVSQLTKQHHTGFSNQIATWNGGRSNLDRSNEEEDRKRRRSEYDEEMDRGRTKKIKHRPEFSKHNPFSFIQNRYGQYPRNNFQRNNGYNRKRHNGSGYQARNGMFRPPPYKRY